MDKTHLNLKFCEDEKLRFEQILPSDLYPIQSIELGHNDYKELMKLFHLTPNLNSLDLSFTRYDYDSLILQIPEKVQSHIRELNLVGNRIVNIQDISFIDQLEKLEKIIIDQKTDELIETSTIQRYPNIEIQVEKISYPPINGIAEELREYLSKYAESRLVRRSINLKVSIDKFGYVKSLEHNVKSRKRSKHQSEILSSYLIFDNPTKGEIILELKLRQE